MDGVCWLLNDTDYQSGAKSLDLSHQVNEFKETCFGWDKYKEDLHEHCFLAIQHVRK
jgi:poly(A) polymerase